MDESNRVEGDTMTREDLGNLGDLLGGIGVVATWLYLVLQIRQNTKQLRADFLAARTIAIESTTTDVGRWIGEILENRDLAELWIMMLRYLKMYFRSPDFHALWLQSKSLLVPDLVNTVEEAAVIR